MFFQFDNRYVLGIIIGVASVVFMETGDGASVAVSPGPAKTSGGCCTTTAPGGRT